MRNAIETKERFCNQWKMWCRSQSCSELPYFHPIDKCIKYNSCKKIRVFTPEQIEKKKIYRKKWLKEKSKEYRQKNKDRMKIYALQYRLTKRGKEVNLRKEKKFSNTPKGFYLIMKRNAIKRNISYLAQVDFINWYEKQNKICFYCSIPQNELYKIKHLTNVERLTIDRCDNNKGYEINNIVLACDICNSIKSNLLSVDEMKKIGQEIIQKKWKTCP